MNALLIYMFKVAVYLAGLYLIYRLFLEKDTFHVRNRIFLLLSLIASFVLPLITIQTKNPIDLPLFGKVLSEIFVFPAEKGTSLTPSGTTGSGLLKWIAIVYLSGVMLFSIKLFSDIVSLLILIVKQKSKGSNIIIFNEINSAGFSAFGQIFINSSLSHTETAEIIKHEQNHILHHHFLDIIVIEVIKVFQWFNPFIHMLNRSLRAIHEFQADEECLNSGVPVISYQHLLLNQVFKSDIFNFSNKFSNSSLIKKRIIMMTKNRSKALTNLKLIMALPAVAIIMIAFSSCNQGNKPAENATEIAPSTAPVSTPPAVENDTLPEPLDIVEEMPVFPGGESALLQYIANNTKYPETAKTNGIQGKVIIRFAVEADGSAGRVSVFKGVDPEIDKEALRVVGTLPSFKPGRQKGEPVAVWYMVPINFTLK